jgi:hypothetical protein
MKKKSTKPVPPAPPAPPAPVLLHRRAVELLILQGKNNASIHAQLRRDGLLDVFDADLGVIRSELHAPKNLNVASLRKKSTVDFLESLGLLDFFKNTPPAVEARQVLEDRRVREVVESAIIAGVPPHALVTVLRTQLHHEVSEEGLQLYSFTFFDSASLSRQDLRLLVERHVRALAARAAAPDDVAAVQRAVRSDARTVAVNLNQSTLAWPAVLLALGWRPPKADLNDVLTQIEGLAATRAGQALIRNGREDAARAERLMSVLQRAREVHAGVSRPEELLVKKMTSLRLKADESRIPNISEIAPSGNRTVDLVPLQNEGADAPVDDNMEEDDLEPGVVTTASQ